MKRLFTIAAFALLALGVFAGDANQMKYVSIVPPNSSTNLTVTGATIDIAAYKGNCTLVVYCGTASATNNVLTATLQHSAASNFANPSTVTNINGTAGVITVSCLESTTPSAVVSTFSIDSNRLKKYVRVVLTTTLADNYIPAAAMFIAPMKSE